MGDCTEAVGGCKGACMGPDCGVYRKLYSWAEEHINKGDSTLGVGKRMKGLDAWWHFPAYIVEMWCEGRNSSLLQGGDPTCKHQRGKEKLEGKYSGRFAASIPSPRKGQGYLAPRLMISLLQKQLQPRGTCHEEYPLLRRSHLHMEGTAQ